MANKSGLKWNKGGAKRRNRLEADWGMIADYADRIETLGGDLEKSLSEVLDDIGEQIQADTLIAIEPRYLPAGGKYSQGDTAKTVDRFPKTEKNGSKLSIGIGFDKTKKGSGGWLITGTPRMQPDRELARIYTQKAYQKKMNAQIAAELSRICSILEG